MPYRKHHVIGKKFGNLTVVSELPPIREGKLQRRKRYMECICDCGKPVKVKLVLLVSGAKTRCFDCFKKNHSRVLSKHGMTGTKEYNIWIGAKKRCENPNSPNYSDYGGRGIRMSPEWVDSFESFFKDMGYCPEGFSLERKDNNSGYNRDNCMWADINRQSNNKRNTILVSYKGRMCPIYEISKTEGICRRILLRLNKIGLNGDNLIEKAKILQYRASNRAKN